MQIKRSLKPQVYSYSRFSDMAQHKGSSIERQENYAKEAAEKYGLQLNKELIMTDLGKSAFNAKHKQSGAYGAFLRAIENGLIAKGSYLIVESFDRLSREQARIAQNDIYQLIEADINIITATDGQLFNKKTLDQNPQLIFLMTATMMRAHEESLTKQKRSIRSVELKVEKFRRGESVDIGGPMPFWLKRMPKGSTNLFSFSDNTEAARIITGSFLDGKSYGQIQDILIEKKINSPKGDSKWGSTTISNVLESATLYGRRIARLPAMRDGRQEAQEHILDNYYPALISKSDFDLIQQIKKVKKKGKTGYRFNSSLTDGVKSVVYLLSGYGRDKNRVARSVCSQCGGALGSRMQDQFARTTRKYIRSVKRLDCLNRTRKKSCLAKGIAQAELERSFLQAVHEHVDYNLLNKADSESRAVEIIDSKLEDLDGVIKRATELFILTDAPEALKIAKQKLQDAQAERRELLKQKDDGKEFIISSQAIQEFQHYVERAYNNDDDFEARSYVKNILLQCVEKLTVDTEMKSLKSFGIKNLYPHARVWTVTVDFRSDKRITVYHDCDKNMSLFNVIEGGDNTQHALTPEALKIWDVHGHEALVKHLAQVGLGVKNYVESYTTMLSDADS